MWVTAHLIHNRFINSHSGKKKDLKKELLNHSWKSDEDGVNAT